MKICPRCRIDTYFIDFRDKCTGPEVKPLPRYVYRCPKCGLQAHLSPGESPSYPSAAAPAVEVADSSPVIIVAESEALQQLRLFDYIPLNANRFKS